MIERIRVRNYRSLRDVEVRLEPLTVLIGRSGSGKSNFVRAVRLLRDTIAASQGQYGPYRNHPFAADDLGLGYEVDVTVRGVERLRYEVMFTPRPGGGGVQEERLVADGRPIFHHADNRWLVEPSVMPALPAGHLTLGRVTGIREAVVAYIALTRGVGCYDFPGTVLQESADPLERGPGYPGSGDTHLAVAGRILDTLDRPDDWTVIGKLLVAINPRLSTLDLLFPGGDRLRTGYAGPPGGRTLTADAADESEGFRRYLAHLLALYQTPPKQTMFFEHPENGIHPGALEALAYEFTSHVQQGRGQVILTTHSPEMLNHFRYDRLRVVAMEDGQTRIGVPEAEQLEALRGNLMTPGDLLTADPARLGPVGAGA